MDKDYEADLGRFLVMVADRIEHMHVEIETLKELVIDLIPRVGIAEEKINLFGCEIRLPRTVEDGYGEKPLPKWMERPTLRERLMQCEARLQEITEARSRRQFRPGSVYVLQADDGPDLYKIGVSRNVNRRLTEIAAHLPWTLSVRLMIESDDPETLERELHHRFAEKRVNGEWFRLTADDLAMIAEHYDEALK